MDKKELIAQYITQKLSREAQKEFDHLMGTDPEFAKEVAFQDNLNTVIENEERDIVKRTLQDFEAEENSTFNYRKWLVAATVIILLGVSSFWYFNSSIDTEKLYADNFEPYRNIVQPIVRGEVKTDLKTKAFMAYEMKKYPEALSHFNELLKENPNEIIEFYKANSLLQLNEIDAAILIFDQNLKTSDSLDAKNNWYLALAYIKNKNIKNAKDQLTHLITSDSTFKNDEAKQLLKKLN